MNFEQEARRIIDLLKRDFVFPDGSFFLEKEGDKVFAHTIHADLGDFLPFFLYFGEDDFVAKQVGLYQKSLRGGLMVSEFKSFGVSGLVKSYEYTDLLLGLCDYYEIRKTEENKKLLIETAEKAISIFGLDKNISSYYYQKLHLRLPLIDTRDGTLIELFVDLYNLTKDKKYLDIADNIFTKLVSLPFYKKQYLLPSFYAPFWRQGKKFDTANICKNTTNSLFGFLALAKTGKPEVYTEIDKILEKLEDVSSKTGGGIPFTYDPGRITFEANLTSSFPVVDFLCDLYEENKKQNYIDFAKKIADFWIGKQGKTGLFPFSTNLETSFFDSETDMTIALYKLWEQTGEVKYKESADKCFQGILKFHGKRDYPLIVDIQTGDVINKTQRTKFLALFLKLLILKIEYDKGSKIYTNSSLWGLLRDR